MIRLIKREVRRHHLRPLAAALALPYILSGCGPTPLEEVVHSAGPISGTFAVSDHFAPSGYMGDGELPGFLLGLVNEGCLPRPAGAAGACYQFSYRPGAKKWAGVFWQFPANNWGTRPGRKVAGKYSRVRFSAAARYSIVLPPGAGVGARCGGDSDCRAGLTCTSGACAGSLRGAEGEKCIASVECGAGLQCVGQVCTTSRGGAEGTPCGAGFDEACGDGLKCAVRQSAFSCIPQGKGDVGSACASGGDCLAGLYCDGGCRPSTRLGPVGFQVGGIKNKTYEDEIEVQYVGDGATHPFSNLTPELQAFFLDLGGEAPTALIGGFMWATPFPNIDEISDPKVGVQPYKADPTRPATIYLDDIVFEEAQ